MGLSPSTLYEWKKKYSKISESLKRGKEVVDIQVEKVLLKRTLGYVYTEKKYEQVEMSDEKYHLKQQIAINPFKLENLGATREELKAVELGVTRYKSVLTHRFVEKNGGTIMIDIFEYKSPFGIVGIIVDKLFLERYMANFISSRAKELKRIAEDVE